MRSVDRIHVDGAVLAVVVVVKYTRDLGRRLGFIQPFEKEKRSGLFIWNAIARLVFEGLEGDSSSPEFRGSLAVPWKALNQPAFLSNSIQTNVACMMN